MRCKNDLFELGCWEWEIGGRMEENSFFLKGEIKLWDEYVVAK